MQEEAMRSRHRFIGILFAFSLGLLATPSLAMDGIPGGGHGAGGAPPTGLAQVYASIRSTLLDDSRVVRDAILGRAHEPGQGGWVAEHSGTDRMDGAGAASLNSRASTGLGGFDLQSGGWRVGVAAGGGEATYRAPAATASASVDSWHAGAWIGGGIGGLRLTGGGAYSHHDVTGRRTDSGGAYNSAFSVETTQAFGEAAYPLKAGPVGLEPYVRTAWVGLRAQGFAEGGNGSTPVSVDGASEGVGYGDLGLRFSGSLGAIRPYADVSWRRAWGDLRPVATGSAPLVGGGGGGGVPVAMSLGDHAEGVGAAAVIPAGSGAIADLGLPVARDGGTVKAGLQAPLGRAGLLSLGYDGVFGKGVNDQGVSLRLSVRF
jgi:outer membrane autotransporter protein